MKISNTQKLDRRTKQKIRIVRGLFRQLEIACPQSSKGLIGAFAIDLGDLVAVSRKHLEHVHELLKMRFPKDRERFRTLLAQLEVNLLHHGQWHLTSLKRRLPRLVEVAYCSRAKKTKDTGRRSIVARAQRQVHRVRATKD